MNDLEQDYRALVADEARGTAPDGTAELLIQDPWRWKNALNQILLDISSQTTFRKAELSEFHTQCRRMADGRERYFQRQSEYLRWEGGMKRFRAGVATRLSEVSRIAKDQKNREHQSSAAEELTTHLRNLAAAVDGLLCVDDGETIPESCWERLEAAYTSLPEYVRPRRIASASEWEPHTERG